jgi:hypothetical protein
VFTERTSAGLDVHARSVAAAAIDGATGELFRARLTRLRPTRRDKPVRRVQHHRRPVISAVHRRHRATEFKKFLVKIDAEVPAHLDVDVVADNYGTRKSPTVKAWLAAHPASTCTSPRPVPAGSTRSKRWFAYLTGQLIRRGNRTSVQALEADLRTWAKTWNENPKPFIWTKTAEQILEPLHRLITRINGAGHSLTRRRPGA